jgi:hypothetical protein
MLLQLEQKVLEIQAASRAGVFERANVIREKTWAVQSQLLTSSTRRLGEKRKPSADASIQVVAPQKVSRAPFSRTDIPSAEGKEA